MKDEQEIREAFNDLNKEIDEKIDKHDKAAIQRRRKMVIDGFRDGFKFVLAVIGVGLLLSVLCAIFL